jgi:hypothetical protein
MKTKEIMIGNYIHFPFIGAIVEVIGIAVRENNEVYFQTKLNNNTFFEKPEKHNPIEITEQWLLKLGFEITYSSNFKLKFNHIKHNEIGFDFSHTSSNLAEGFRYYGNHIKIRYEHYLNDSYTASRHSAYDLYTIDTQTSRPSFFSFTKRMREKPFQQRQR